MSTKPILSELGRLERAGLIELDPRAMIDVIRIVDLVGEHNTEALAHSLASRLTHDPARHAHVLRALHPAETAVSRSAPASAHPSPRAEPVRLADDGPAPRRPWRLPRLLRGLSGTSALALLSVCSLAVVLGGPFATRALVAEIDPDLAPPPSPDAASAVTPPVDLPPPGVETFKPGTRLDPIASGRRGEVFAEEQRPVDPPGPTWLVLTLILGGAVVLVFGAAWWSAPLRYHRLVELARQRARDQRERWNREGHVSAVPYHIEPAPPFSPAHIDDAATILGRLFRRESGPDLDVTATVTATVDAGGQLTPIFASGRRREQLLVLVDRESRQHPHLLGVEWLLARWRRLGLRVLRFDYHNTLDTLHPEHGPALTLDALRRQTAGLTLLVFSRMRGARGYQGRVTLARDLDAWPLRAWLDLDPTPHIEQDRELQRVARTLENAGTPRYPFTGAGVLAAARGLVEGFPRHRLVSEPPLALAAALDIALMVWAGTAACVPDASWAQLDALRRHFEGFSELTAEGAPLDARALERLLAWISARGYHSGVLGEGTRLYFTLAGRRALLRNLRRYDRERWPADRWARYEARARRLLLEQIHAADLADDPYRKALSDMKVAMHEAVLDPARAEELLRGFADKAVAYELTEQLSDELALQAGGDSFGRPWSARTREAITAYVHGDARARLPDLLELPRLDARQAAAALALVVASVASWALWWSSQPTTRTVEHGRLVELPPAWRVTADDDPVALANVAPMRFKVLPGGTFDMGSPQAELDYFKATADESFVDERTHPVEVSPFELATTEVTNAQWKAVMGGVSPSECSYGCNDKHPVQVSWVMAIEYLNKLTDRENEKSTRVPRLIRCYELSGDTWKWVRGCTGYRLPTEAEWEYAARAGTTTAYGFGDEVKELCKHGNGADLAFRREHPNRTVNEGCDDGAANLAEVGSYRANAWGLYDMHGNVWEWVWDGYDSYEKKDPKVLVSELAAFLKRRAYPPDVADRVLRGGSFIDPPVVLRSANRNWGRPMNVFYGFRCARGSPPSP